MVNGAACGERVHLSDLKGQSVILDFWATWCEPCQIVAPILERISKKHQGKLVVFGVNTSDAPGQAPIFAKKKGLSYPIVYDEGDEVAHQYGVENLPTLVVIGPDGNITSIRAGVESESAIEELVAKASM